MYTAEEKRYDEMKYARCGSSGIKLSRLSLGLWHNFGSVDNYENMRDMIHTAFDAGITHFDLANNYGPVYGSAEENFGRIMDQDMRPYRDEMLISTKAGYDMWPGPYGDWGSRKYLMASLDQSLKRMHLDYVDIFYHHRPDPETPMEETLQALSDIVKQGKALYIGLSKYDPEQTRQAAKFLRENGTPLLINQFRYNMFDRHAEEEGLLETLDEVGAGSIVFSPLAQGVLTGKYLHGIPEGSRATKNHFLKSDSITPELIAKVQKLNELAGNRDQTLAEMALSWDLRKQSVVKKNAAGFVGGAPDKGHECQVTSVIIGASRSEQILDNVKALEHLEFTEDEIAQIEKILAE